ncbi:MAG: hypothetical protein ACYCZV_05490 [Acidimicrobiales bacterium]
MKKKDLEKLIEDEVEASESSRDRPISEGAVRKAEASSVVYSLRLTPAQTEQIHKLAEAAGIPPSALVRDWVMRGLAAEVEASSLDALVETLSRDVDQLRRSVARRQAS